MYLIMAKSLFLFIVFDKNVAQFRRQNLGLFPTYSG